MPVSSFIYIKKKQTSAICTMGCRKTRDFKGLWRSNQLLSGIFLRFLRTLYEYPLLPSISTFYQQAYPQVGLNFNLFF